MSKVSNESMQGDELSQSQQRFFPSCVASIGNRKSLQRERMKSDQGVLNGFHEE